MNYTACRGQKCPLSAVLYKPYCVYLADKPNQPYFQDEGLSVRTRAGACGEDDPQLPHLRQGVHDEQGAGPAQGLNSIEYQQDLQWGFQLSTGHSVRQNAPLNSLLNSVLKFN